MQDISYQSQGGKTLVAAVAAPPEPNEETGALLWLHGWGGNRFQYAAILPEFAERFNLYVVSPEWRQCGYDCNPETGSGICQPYDFSHLQVVDCLNALQAARTHFPLNDRRLFAWGGGQGGHIALLLAAYAARTFAMVCDVAGFSYVDSDRVPLLGWEPSPLDYQIRDARNFARQIRARVWLIHGDLDQSVPIEHAYSMAGALHSAGKQLGEAFLKGAHHMLDPITDRRQASLDYLADDLAHLQTDGATELASGETVRLACPDGTFIVSFGRGPIEIRPE
jgi:pimeloyl-ACP methyl ester carboxylesterase